MKKQKNAVIIEVMTEEPMKKKRYSHSYCSRSFGEKKERRRRISGIHHLTLVLFAEEVQVDAVAVVERTRMTKKWMTVVGVHDHVHHFRLAD
jgi:hypothetical protein